MQSINNNRYPAFIMNGTGIGQYRSEDRNMLMNGDMQVDQVNEGASVTVPSGTPTYIVDGAKISLVQSSAVVTGQRVAVNNPQAQGYQYALKVTVSTGHAVGTTDSLLVQLPVEGPMMRYLNWGHNQPGYVSLGFWAMSSLAGEVYTMSIQNSAKTRMLRHTFTIPLANQWTWIAIPGIVGDSTTTWLTTDGTVGAYINIVLASGTSNESGTVDSWTSSALFAHTSQTNNTLTTSGATFQITGVQFEAGPVNTPFALRPYDRQMALCQRQYRKSFLVGTAPAQNVASVVNAVTIKNPIAAGDPSHYLQFNPRMCATPVITTYNPSAANANWRNITQAADAAVSVDPATSVGPDGVLLATAGTDAALGDILAIHYTADARL